MAKSEPADGQRGTPTPATWGYETHNGPALWGTLGQTFSVCTLGREQSPIDLTGGRRADLAPVEFDYGRTRMEVENTGHTIQMNPEPGHGIVLDGMRHELLQFHFHRGSEHLVDGARFAMELHLVHRNGDAGLAVVGILIAEGEENAALAPVWAHLPPVPGPSDAVTGEIDLAALLPPLPHDVALPGLAHDAALHRGRRLGYPGPAVPDVSGPDRGLRRPVPEQLPPRATARRPRPAPRVTVARLPVGHAAGA